MRDRRCHREGAYENDGAESCKLENGFGNIDKSSRRVELLRVYGVEETRCLSTIHLVVHHLGVGDKFLHPTMNEVVRKREYIASNTKRTGVHR